MKNKEAPASSRVSAAKAILDIGIKATEIEQLEERFETIEKRIREAH
jgi:hypothetical protein